MSGNTYGPTLPMLTFALPRSYRLRQIMLNGQKQDPGPRDAASALVRTVLVIV